MMNRMIPITLVYLWEHFVASLASTVVVISEVKALTITEEDLTITEEDLIIIEEDLIIIREEALIIIMKEEDLIIIFKEEALIIIMIEEDLIIIKEEALIIRGAASEVQEVVLTTKEIQISIIRIIIPTRVIIFHLQIDH